jgi:NAD(P)-dependent dehydrogenase (short-subunit alcohol dehydrogenase family)
MTAFDLKAQFDLTGKVAMLTGSANILGPEFADALAQFGAETALVDVNAERVSEVSAHIEKNRQVKSRAYVTDVSVEKDIKNATEQIIKEFGKIDILVAAAAAKPDGYFADQLDYPLDAWDRVMAVNLGGVFLAIKQVVPHFISRGGGTIVNISSIYGVVGPDMRIYEDSNYLGGAINTPPPYSASKAGVIGLTRYMATTLAKSGIRVNSITPGGVESGQNEEFVRRYSERIPMNRMADRTDLQGAVVYLASEASSYVTGQNLVVDGGMTAW